jgi:hypothetical protein
MTQILKKYRKIGWILALWLLLVGQAIAQPGHQAAVKEVYNLETFEKGLEYDLTQTWLVYRSRNRLSSDENKHLRENLRRWQSLSPEKQQQMRHLMQQWRQMPPQEKKRYQNRFRQWQQLSPPEQQQMRNKLKRWDSLPENEKDRVRQKFQLYPK